MGQRALIYNRVSQDRNEGRSPAEQEAESRQFAEREGWSVVHVVTDTKGASRYSKGKRPGWATVRRMIEGGEVDVLVTWESSRAQRDLGQYADFRDLCARNGVRWFYKGRLYDLSNGRDRFDTGLDALLAEREVDETRDRILRNVRANAAAGRPHGRRLYGYERIYDSKTGILVTQAPHPLEAQVVRRVFADYLAGQGFRTIANALNAEGFATSTGRPWEDGQVKRVLMNPHYVARRVHHGEVVAVGSWPAIVDVEVFERVQARIAHQSSSQTRQVRRARLLTGVARCGVCASKMAVGHDRRGRKVYQCRGTATVGERKTIACVARDERMLDAYVTEQLLDRLAGGDVELGDAPDETADLRAEVAALKARHAEAIQRFNAGELSGATLVAIEADLLPKITEAERAVRRALVPIAIDMPEDGDIASWWDDVLTPEQRRSFVAAVIVAVSVLPTRRGSRTFDEDAVEIEWRRPFR